ncbi:MAG: aminotransferase class V-fold PLP-dependent enzyme [Planctomycetaceae bacterium]
MDPETRIYLDNAATSFPKPEPVIAAVVDYMTQCGVAAGRGSSRRATELDGRIAACRGALARMWNAESPREILFTLNGTDSLNLAIYGVLRPGDHVVTTELEHNSVLRPLRMWEAERGVTITHVPPAADGRVNPQHVAAAVQKNTRLVAITHASNVTGVVQPIEEIGDAIRSRPDVLYLVDAAQTAGHRPIDVQQSRIDLLCCSGHKGLLGPLGTGVVSLRASRVSEVRSWRQGGTGSQSESLDQPTTAPDKYESGNPNAAGIVGLAAALDWIQSQRIDSLSKRAQDLAIVLYLGLMANPRVRIVSPDPARISNVGVISFVLDGVDPRVAATLLDSHFGIEVRAGLHCAPLIHRSLGTLDSGGTIRASVGPFTQDADIDALLAALMMITTAM